MGSSWIASFSPNPHAETSLFCFPYAGGNPSIYRDWHRYLPSSLEVCPIQLPGHGARMEEKPFFEIKPLINELANFFTDFSFQKKSIFFGHSLGALIAFELVREIKKRGGVEPSLFIASSCSAPHWPMVKTNDFSTLPDASLIEYLRQLGGTPEEVLKDTALMKLFLPMIRADLKLTETYLYEEGELLSCPILACGGEHDSRVSLESLKAWDKQTSSTFKMQIFSGDHFYLHSSKEALLRKISEEIQSVIPKLF